MINHKSTDEEDESFLPPDVVLDENKVPSYNTVVEFKKPKNFDPEGMHDKYGQVVSEQIRERKAMNDLGYEVNRDIDDQY